MNVNPLYGSIKTRKRKGRGNASGLGGECGRGHKGQRSRSGFSLYAGFEGGQTPLYMRLPKKKGFKNIFKKIYHPINLSQLSELAIDNIVSPESLVEQNIIKRGTLLKILGDGNCPDNLTIKAHKISKSALSKIDSSKSSFELV